MMKSLVVSVTLLFGSLTVWSKPEEIYFLSDPCLSPDGKTIVFTYESDLWQVASSGGTALRLTSMDGQETRAKFSPDGKWIAFTGSQNGNDDIYVMDVEGGEIKQLTFHESYDHLDNWSWDSKTIYFTSGRSNRLTGYSISIEGGTPVLLYDDYFHMVHNLTPHPNGELFFSESWESKTQAYRKRYKGSFNPDIQSYNAAKKEFKKYTEYEGKDMWPTIDKNGNIYFVSDELNGEYNLYTFKSEKKTSLTNFTTSIRNPFVNSNGDKLVFEKDYQIYLYDTQSTTSKKVSIYANNNTVLAKEKDFNVNGKITYFDVSQDGKKLAFVSRGVLFVSDLKGKFVGEIKTDSKERVMEVKWLSDNLTLLYSQTTSNGFYNWFTVAADGKGKPKQLTKDDQNNRSITFNKDLTKGVYLSGRNDVCLIDLKTFTVQKIVNEELWGNYNSTPMFSPNGEYVLFTAFRDFEEDIFIFNLVSKKLVNLTKTGVTESGPHWSPDGKYIYFTSNRFEPAYPFGLNESHVYRMSLEKIDNEFLSEGYEKLFVEERDKKTDKAKNTNETKKVSEEVKKYVIDIEGMFDRMEQVSPGFGTQGNPQVFEDKDKTMIFYPSNHDENKNSLWLTTYEKYEKPVTVKIEGTDDAFTIVKSNDQLYTLIHGSIHIVKPDTKKTEKIEISHVFRKNLKNEFNQMFTETWANMKENFYSEDFHGIDWSKKKEQYGAFLPYVHSRSDLRSLISDMLGELNASHTGFYSSGDEEKTDFKTVTLSTGILFEKNQPFVVSGIVKNSPADKKGIELKAGDVLAKVNDETVDKTKNRESYFVKPSRDEEISLTFSRDKTEFTVKIHPASYRAINDLLHDGWIENNQKIVDTKSNNRIAYSCMKNMGNEELEKFIIDMTREVNNKEGLILDLRYNTGGNVHNKVLQFLSQRPYMKWKYREGKYAIQPNFYPGQKPIVLLINEQSLSDAEVTAAGFKALKIGKIIGTETYRWIIFTGGNSLVDGSRYRLPSWGCYTLSDENLETNGVSPDIDVPMTFMDRLEKKDPQLDRAIAEILKELK